MDLTPQPDLIYDVGAHRGEDSEFYLKAGYRVVAVEANPRLAEDLRSRFASEVAAGRYIVIERAIAAEAGSLTFFVNDALSDWGTTDPKWAARNARFGAPSRPIAVTAERFATVLSSQGCPHYCKIDVEGADPLCLAGLAETGMRPPMLSIETEGESWAALKAEFRALTALGYTRFKVVDQRRHPRGPFQARDGASFSHDFAPGASGPFGDAIPGPWLCARQAMRRYRLVYLRYKLLDNNPRLIRALQRIPLLRRLTRLVTWHDTHALHESAIATGR